MIRAMTYGEKNRFVGYFPALNPDLQPRVTGEATGAPPGGYNCIAWTLGYTDRWIDPYQTVAEWDAFYNPTFVRADSGPIAIWKRGRAFTHGCVYNYLHGFPWESKCGSDLRILHQLDELVGDSYGNVFMYYQANPPLPPPGASGAVVHISGAAAKPQAMTDKERATLIHQAIRDVAPAVRQEFEEQFEAWKRTWFEGAMAFSSDTNDRADGYCYRALVDMGTEIIPLVVEKLNDPKNFIAQRLYEDLQPDPQMRVVITPSDPAAKEGVQGHAQRTVEHYLKSLK